MARPHALRLAAVLSAILVFSGVACSAVRPPAAAPTSAPAAAFAPGTAAGESLQSKSAAPPPGQPAAVAAPPQNANRSASTDTDAASGDGFSAEAAQPLDRMVIRTAQLVVEVTDIEPALAQVRQLAQQGGGFVSASNTRVEKVGDQDRTVADLTIQVRSDSTETVLSALRGLGKVTSETSGSQDVTEEYVDLDSNLRNLQASEAAILKLMDKATRIEDILSLQRELTNVRGQIERIQGRKRYLERRTDMATITLSLRLPPVEGARPTIGGAWDPLAVAARGWQASLTVLRGVAEVLIVLVAFSWWLIPLLALGAYVWLHRRRPSAAPTTPTGATPGPTPTAA